MFATRRLTAPLAAVAVLALTATACTSSTHHNAAPSVSASTSTSASSAGTITIAIGGPFSGAEKPTGDQIQAGANLAAAQINHAGGIASGPRKGAMLVLKPYDDADDPAQAASTVRDMISDSSVVGFVGSGLSDGAIAAAPIASRADFPYLAAYASSEEILSAATGAKSVFVVPPTFPAYAISVTDALLAAGHTRIALLHLTGTYGQGIATDVQTRLSKAGITPVSDSSFSFTTTDFRTQLAVAKAAKPDALVMVGLADSDAAILKQAAMIGLKVPAYDPGGITNSDTFLQDAGSLANGVVGNSPTNPQRNTPASVALRTAYAAATGQSVVPDPAAFAYEGIQAIAAAFADGASGRSDLASYLHKIAIPDTGVGPLSFSADGSCIGGILYVFTIVKGVPVIDSEYQQTGPTTVIKVPLTN